MAPHNRKTPTGALVALALVGAALLAGCAGLGNDNGGNRAPTAHLEADRTKGWGTDAFAFDGRSSTDPDGNVTSWRFDFGDGSNVTVTSGDAAHVTHAYAKGGEYLVTLTVVDDGTHDGLEKKADSDTVRVAVDERYPVDATVVRSPLNSSAGATMGVPFDVRAGADQAVANLTLRNLLPTGASEVRFRVLDADGKVLHEQSEVLNGTAPRALRFTTDLPDTGNHTLQVTAMSGSVQVTGELQVVYSDSMDAKMAASTHA